MAYNKSMLIIKETETFTQWRDALKDRIAAARITARLDRHTLGILVM